LRKGGFTTFKVIVKITNDCEVPIQQVYSCVRMCSVISSRLVPNRMNSRLPREIDSPDLCDGRADELRDPVFIIE
jgi:hypothetical protein